jgi:hypothetical protein
MILKLTILFLRLLTFFNEMKKKSFSALFMPSIVVFFKQNSRVAEVKLCQIVNNKIPLLIAEVPSSAFTHFFSRAKKIKTALSDHNVASYKQNFLIYFL